MEKIRIGALKSVISSGISASINGSDFLETLTESLKYVAVTTVLSFVQESIGDIAQKYKIPDGDIRKVLGHAIAGGLASKALGGSFEAGALAAAVSEVSGDILSDYFKTPAERIQVQQLLGAFSAFITGKDATDVNLAGMIAASVQENNRELHVQEREILAEMFKEILTKEQIHAFKTGNITEELFNSLPEEAQKYFVAACALARCGNVPEGDRRRNLLKTLEGKGHLFPEHMQVLINKGKVYYEQFSKDHPWQPVRYTGEVTETIPVPFEYSWNDSLGDQVRLHNELVTRVAGAGNAVTGGIVMGTSVIGTGTVCAGTAGAGCLVVGGLGAAGATYGANKWSNGINQAFGEYESDVGDKVLASLNPFGSHQNTDMIAGSLKYFLNNGTDLFFSSGLKGATTVIKGVKNAGKGISNTIKNIPKNPNLNKLPDRLFKTKIDSNVVSSKHVKLREDITQTFKNGEYATVKTIAETPVYRKFGGGANQAKINGNFVGTEQNLGRAEAALYPKWNSTRFEAEIVIPKDVQIHIGKVAPQPVGSPNPKYRGGADQVLLPRNYSNDWIKSIKDGKTGKTYSLSEFKSKFPNQFR